MNKNLNKKGFTIVELVIVIAVIGILAAVLIPTFSNVIDSAKESAALQEAKNEINAYNSFMASKGYVLGDGTVLRVGEETVTNNVKDYTWFVYYNNQLEKISDPETEIVSSIPTAWGLSETIKVGETEVALDKYIIIDEEVKLSADYKKPIPGEEDQVVSYDEEAVAYLFCNLTTEVEFSDGSQKVAIFAGKVNLYYNKLTAESSNVNQSELVKKQNNSN